MKLDQMVKYIVFPSDVTKDDTEYILYLLYPKYVDYDIKRYTLRIYEKVMNNEGRYPKDYMYGYLGMLRAKICLQYAINQNLLFKSADDLYNFFASKDCIKYLKQNKLYQLYVSFYSTPLEYMHDSMPSSVKNEFLFHNYMFLNKYQQVVTEEEKGRKKQGALNTRLVFYQKIQKFILLICMASRNTDIRHAHRSKARMDSFL